MKKLLFLILLFTCFFCFPQANINSKIVLENYIEALGGREKLLKVKTLKAFSKASFLSITLQAVELKMYPNKYKNYFDKENYTVFNGEKGYTIQQGVKMDLDLVTIDILKKGQIFDVLSWDINVFEKTVKKIKKNNIDYYTIKNKNIIYFFNCKTNLLELLNEGDKKNTFSNYIDVEGYKFPSVVETEVMGRTM